VTTKGKKLIFSTNLPSIRDIDSALVRPGRCFDIVNFDTLTQSEAEVLSARLGVTLDGTREKWSIAEVFNKQVENSTIKKVGRKVGFI
jgi:ATP-dependent 26S proteasome regulatory subunit